MDSYFPNLGKERGCILGLYGVEGFVNGTCGCGCSWEM